MTTATSATPVTITSSTAIHRLTSLGRAEWLQFRRNKTLLFMATVFPLGLPLLIFVLGDNDATTAAHAFDMFVVYTLLFVQFYTVLSMATTRRDERVLKRLRTGEARDREILGAISLPGALLTVVFSVVITFALLVLGAPAPVNVALPIFAVLIGLVFTTALALLTSAFTRNAEAAQLTALPVFTLALLGFGAFRPIFGDGAFGEIMAWNPYALISDLVHLGWAGNTFLEQVTGAEALGVADTLAEGWPMLLALLVWTAVALFGVKRYMRWDSHR